MSLSSNCQALVRKYGKAAKVVACGVLNVVAPGSATLIDMAEKALGVAQDFAEDSARDRHEAEMLAGLGRNEAELARLGELLECLTGPLAVLCDKAAAFADQPDDIPDIIARAIAGNPSLSKALHHVEGLKAQFDAFHADLRRVAEQQADAIPVFQRMNRMADYFDELWQAGVRPKDFAHCVHSFHEAARQIEQGRTADLDPVLLELRTATPKAASVCVLEAAAATREADYPAAQRALQTAVRLRPADAELADLSRRATVLATRVTPKRRPSEPEASATAAGPRLQPGDMLDGWLLEARLGAGGWGQVFKATRNGETKALKVMHAEHAADPAFEARFKKEIESLIRLPRHPNLVRIEGFDRCPDRRTLYLLMEHLDGPTLEDHLSRKGPFTEGQARGVFPAVVDGLARAHAAGIAHRDIKPGNLIFRRSDQRLVLVDFGLAVETGDFGKTKVGGISIQFAAPEQHYGEPATQASDVFSLCAVIHYALNYDKPAVRKPNTFAPGLVPESLRAALTQGMKPNVAERFADAGQLHAALAGAPPLAIPVGPTADPVTEYARWKQQVEELKAQSQRAADIHDYARAVAILDTVPTKHRDNARLADWTGKRDRLAKVWGLVESGWKEMSEDELAEHLEEVVDLHPDHPRAKPWLAQFGTKAERQRKKLSHGKVGAVVSNTLGMKFAWVPPGRSWLGGGGGTAGTKQFVLSEGLWCGVGPVTQAEWQAVMGNNPSHFSGNPTWPVEKVSWDDVQEFLKKINARLAGGGLTYRLTSEDEWEYICRGGPMSNPSQSAYHYYFARSATDLTPNPTNDLSAQQANFNSSVGHPSQLGLYLPNPLGIYDLHGNVWEWTSSLYDAGPNRVFRGGSWYFVAGYCSASYRGGSEPDYRRNFLGFRLLAVPVRS